MAINYTTVCADVAADQASKNLTSPTGGTVCKLLQESGAGLGSFLELITSPVGALIMVLIIVGIVGAVGFAIARIITGFINR